MRSPAKTTKRVRNRAAVKAAATRRWNRFLTAYKSFESDILEPTGVLGQVGSPSPVFHQWRQLFGRAVELVEPLTPAGRKGGAR